MAERELSREEARRIALRAQGFGGARSNGNLRTLRSVAARLHCIQIDAVNVLIRTHYLPMYSRAGAYDTKQLDRLAYERRELFEFKPKNMAGLFSTELYPLFRSWMAPAGNQRGSEILERIEAGRPGYIDAVVDEIAERGPLAFTELSDPGRIPEERRQTKYAASSVLWGTWAVGDAVLNALAGTGRLTISRRKGFEPQFDLTERVIPAEVLARPVPPAEEAQRELTRLATRALGVATVKEIAGYFRLPVASTRARVRELDAAGEVASVRVDGWKEPAYLAAGHSTKPVTGQALLSLFDSLLWERPRVARLFDFEHVFELYVPPAKRRYGYYVLPFLLDERLVARVDLKADRAGSTLLVPGAFGERDVDKAKVTDALVTELRLLASWLDLDHIAVGDRGDLASAIRTATP